MTAMTSRYATALARPGDAWPFGYGKFDEGPKRVAAFTPLPHFTGSAWQGGPTRARGRHGLGILAPRRAATPATTPVTPRFAAGPRRGTGPWRSPASSSTCGQCGDGVRGRIVSSRSGVLGAWPVKTSEAATAIPAVKVQAGDTIDFVTDCVGDVNCDSFEWTVKLTLADSSGKVAGAWDSAADFHGPRGRRWRSRSLTPGRSSTSGRSRPTSWTGPASSRPGRSAGARAFGRKRRQGTDRADQPVSATPHLQRVPLCGLTIAIARRRAFLAHSAFGVGVVRPGPPAAGRRAARRHRSSKPGENLPLNLKPARAALRPQGDGDDLAVHARRAVARRPARPQARAQPSRTAPSTAARSSSASSTGPARSCSAARGSSRSTASAAPRSPSCCPRPPGSSTTSA